MLNKLCHTISRYQMLQPGDHVVCAVSGGADSVALLFAMYLLREKLQITLSAAHFNHRLRGEESDRDEAFTRQLCDRLDIPLAVGAGDIVPGKKGLEAAAREARYAFLKTLPGKIATAHTANDNLETVLMHLVRGTGLKGLGGIAPVNGCLIRPMLDITRQEILDFLSEYHLAYVTDSSNAQNIFMRNRLRMQVIPLLEQENPNLAQSVTQLAQRLRYDDAVLQNLSDSYDDADVRSLRALSPSIRSRVICRFLQRNNVNEPESSHIQAVERLIYSEKPSARITLRDGIVIARNYNRLECISKPWELQTMEIVPGNTALFEAGMNILCRTATELRNTKDCFTIVPAGKLYVRHRLPGDSMRLSGGTKDLKKLFIDRKIPASKRLQIPVIADDLGVVGVFGVGVNLDRLAIGEDAVEICFMPMREKEEDKG